MKIFSMRQRFVDGHPICDSISCNLSFDEVQIILDQMRKSKKYENEVQESVKESLVMALEAIS